MQLEILSQPRRSSNFYQKLPGLQQFLSGGSYEIDDLKVILTIGLINSYEQAHYIELKRIEEQQKEYHQKLFKIYNIRNDSIYEKIDPRNQKIRQLSQAKDYFSILKGYLQTYIINRKQQRNKNKKLSNEFKPYSRRSRFSEQIFLEKFHRQTIESGPSKLIPINNTSLKVDNIITQPASYRKYQENTNQGKRKQQTYIFNRLNRTVQHFSKNNQITVSFGIFNMLTNSLLQCKNIVNRNAKFIVNDEGPYKNRIVSYLSKLKSTFRHILQFLLEIIVFNKKPQKNTLNEISKVKISSDSNLELELKSFDNSIISLIETIRIFFNVTHLKQILTFKKKEFGKVLHEVANARYTLNYLMKETENMGAKKIKKLQKKSVTGIDQINKKWMTAYAKKFLPKVH